MVKFGSIGILSWILTGSGAIFLALVFSDLCRRFPKTGGPHVYVSKAFGKKIAFFTAWTYWVISWISSAAVVIAAVSYVSHIINDFNIYLILILEIIVTILLMLLNLCGLYASRKLDFLFFLLKIFPLIILPLICLPLINYDYFTLNDMSMTSSYIQTIQSASLVTFWGFIGVETATAPAESVFNPSKTVPRAIIIGTACVILVYLLSNIAVLGTVPNNILINSIAPFAESANIVLGGNWNKFIAFTAVIICLSTLNAWILTSGQIALGAAQDKLFPKLFLKKNKQGAPVWGIVLSSLGMVILLFCTIHPNLVNQIELIIDISVTAFLWVYIICIVSYLKIIFISEPVVTINSLIGITALIFCVWVIFGSNWCMLLFSLLITISGVPIYIYMNYKY